MSERSLLEDLEARGLVQECTDRDGFAARLTEGPITAYYGCDPTAPSLHVGNLLGLLILRRLHDAGHKPLALVGGATGMIGDPSGRSQERNLLDEATLAANVASLTSQITKIVDPDGALGTSLMVDNRDWTGQVSFLDFLRDVGKHVTVGTMLGRESVKNRLASEHGISFTEFSYMLIQANDFRHLEDVYGCQLQLGGSDQLGNMIGGIDLIRRVNQRAAWVLAWPLLTAADGTKLGKTTGARIWLDPDLTSPYQFFQHWMSTDDRQVGSYLARFTLLPMTEVAEIMAVHEAEPGRRAAQRRLAAEATALVHGAGEAVAAQEASAILFGAPVVDAAAEALEAVATEVGRTPLRSDRLAEGLDLVEALVELPGLAASKGEARRAVGQGGIYVNGERAAEGQELGPADLLHGRYLLVRKGKKAYGVFDVVADSA